MSESTGSKSRTKIFLDILKSGDWLTQERVLLWSKAFTFAWIFLLIFDIWTHSAYGSIHIMDKKGEHMGRDFINYWSGAKEALGGHAPAIYDLRGFHAYQQSLVGARSEMKMYSYPPVLLLLTLPLGLLPFQLALLLWSAAGVFVCMLLVRQQTGWRWPLTFIAAVAAPADIWNLIAGQNGYFTAAFLAGGLILLDRRPALAGIVMGLLCYKPQFGILLPVALMAGRQWRAFSTASIVVIGLGLASALVFGVDCWTGFLHQMKAQRIVLENVPRFRMPTIYSASRLLHFSDPLAYAAQVLSALGAAAVVAVLWRGKSPAALKYAALCIAVFLATPYAWDYDMIVLTFAVIWLVQDGARSGFLPWEKFTWMLVIALPTPLMAAAQWLGFQPAPFVLWIALALIWRRARAGTTSPMAGLSR